MEKESTNSLGPNDAVPGTISNRRLTAFKSSRGTLITDETGTQEIIKGNELYEQDMIPARYYGGFQRQVLMNGDMDEWAMHMTNPKTLPNNFQLSPEGRIPVKLKDIFEREKDSYESLGYSYLRIVSRNIFSISKRLLRNFRIDYFTVPFFGEIMSDERIVPS